MAYTFQQICDVKASGTGRDVAELLGIEQPADSKVTNDLFLMTTGNRHAREAAEEVAAGNGHGLWGTKRRGGGNGGGSKKAVDPLATIADIEIVMAARLAAKKAGIDETGEGIRDAIEADNEKVCMFLEFALSEEQLAALKKAVGVMTPEQREAKKRADLVAAIRMAVLKAARLDTARKELEAAGFAVDPPVWFAEISAIDLFTLDAHGTAELSAIADKLVC